jgi:hypothetical protein
MKRTSHALVVLCLLLAATVSVAAPGVAQTRLVVSGGPAEYDLSGTGWSGTVGAHVELPIRDWARAELGSGAFWYRTQGDTRVVMLLPEVGAAFQAPPAFPVYLGLGAGYTLGVAGDPPNEPTVYGALGFSFAPTEDWTIRPEMRVRSIDPFVGVIAGFTLGVSLRLGA